LFFTEPAERELTLALRQRIDAPRASDAERSATRHDAVGTFNWSTLAPRYAQLYSELADSV
jgi:glycosyltransferase involved in cell wall biosynthesis